MIQEAFYDKVTNAAAALPTPILYGIQKGTAAPFYVMQKISDAERPESVCESQGQSGRALFQFTVASRGTAGSTEALLEDLKDVVADIIGDFVYNGTTYNIWNNVTTGVVSLGGASLDTWDAEFETTIWWEIKS